MASFKGDTRYTRFADDAPDHSLLESDEHSDVDVNNALVMQDLLRERKHWITHYYDELQLLFDNYITVGRQLFGGAFHQIGNFDDFAYFVFRCTQPGANFI